MAALHEELSAYNSISEDLASSSAGKWVLIHNCRLIDLFNSWERATTAANERFGRGPYLVRQIQANR